MGVAYVIDASTVPKIAANRWTNGSEARAIRGGTPLRGTRGRVRCRSADTLTGVNDTPAPDVWLTLPDVAEQLGTRISDVRRMIEDHQLIAVRRGERKVLSVPADFLGEDGPRPELAGTFTVLRDGRFTDDEIIEWMFQHDDTLPGGPTPMAAILAGFKTEVRRRAMEEAL